MADCTTILHAATAANDLIAACLQADATIHAAKIQAKSATIAGIMALLTGGAALIAGILAYSSAMSQVRLTERQHAARAAAYRWHIRAVMVDLGSQAEIADTVARALSGQRYGQFNPPAVSLPDQLDDRFWEQHALLGEACVRQIVYVREHVREYQALLTNVRDLHLSFISQADPEDPSADTLEKRLQRDATDLLEACNRLSEMLMTSLEPVTRWQRLIRLSRLRVKATSHDPWV